jgi:hypothetical protein
VASNGHSQETVRKQIQDEREQLAHAVEQLRAELQEAANVAERLKGKLPLLAGGALAGGFVLAGGLGATARLIFRRGREGRERARVGRFRVLERD